MMHSKAKLKEFLRSSYPKLAKQDAANELTPTKSEWCRVVIPRVRSQAKSSEMVLVDRITMEADIPMFVYLSDKLERG
jgi:hypothetical protein